MTRKHITLCLFSFFGISILLFFGTSGFAANIGEIVESGSGISVLPEDLPAPEIPGSTGEEKIDRAVLMLINVILYICGTAAGIMILVGGIRYVLSLGNDDALQAAKKTILWAMGGLIMVILAWMVILNVVRVGSLEQRLDSSENPIGDQCGPNLTIGCKGRCCGCGGPLDCDEELTCGGPLDVSGIKVCQ